MSRIAPGELEPANSRPLRLRNTRIWCIMGGMPVDVAARLSREAKKCHVLAERSPGALDKEMLLRLAAEWMRLAQEVENGRTAP